MNKLTQLHPGLNAYKLSFDQSLLDEIRASYLSELHPVLSSPENRRLFDGGKQLRQPLAPATNEYFAVSFLSYPLLWLSSHTTRTYDIYRRFYDKLGIEEEVRKLIDHDRKIVMYCGFLVVSERSGEANFHVDYWPGANAFSLLTPLFELDPGHGNLLYKIDDRQQDSYEYTLGEAVMFGDHFSHCTEPYDYTGRLRVLVTLQFGTDKMQYWDILKKTIESQSEFLILPCGHRLGTCGCATRTPAAAI